MNIEYESKYEYKYILHGAGKIPDSVPEMPARPKKNEEYYKFCNECNDCVVTQRQQMCIMVVTEILKPEAGRMGNRILKESILMSAEIDGLSWFEEVFFYRLIVTADDRGIYPADPVILSHILFPRKENVTKKMAEQALDTLERLGLIRRYRVEGKGTFLILTSWSRHQRLRNSRPKYPLPEEAEERSGSFADAQDDTGAAVARNDKAETVPENKRFFAGAQNGTGAAGARNDTGGPAAVPDPPEEAVVSLPLNDGSEFGVSRRAVEEYEKLYPAVDVLQELRAMRGWCMSNTTRRKTRSGVRRFVNGWLARAQDRGGHMSGPPAQAPAYTPNPYLTIDAEGSVL